MPILYAATETNAPTMVPEFSISWNFSILVACLQCQEIPFSLLPPRETKFPQTFWQSLQCKYQQLLQGELSNHTENKASVNWLSMIRIGTWKFSLSTLDCQEHLPAKIVHIICQRLGDSLRVKPSLRTTNGPHILCPKTSWFGLSCMTLAVNMSQGRPPYQSSFSSTQYSHKRDLSVLWNHSRPPWLCGWYALDRFCWIPRHFKISVNILWNYCHYHCEWS